MLVFIHINKTAGRTVRYILRSTFGLRHCEVEPGHAAWSGPPFSTQDLLRLRKIYPKLSSIGGHRIRAYVDLEENGTEFKYFTFMRDPIKTTASHFQYNIQYRGKKNLVFEDWIQRDWPRNRQTKMIARDANVSEAIRTIQAKGVFVGITERFDESMILLKDLIVPDLNISYRPVNVARSNTLAQQLLSTARTRQLLIEANQADIELYNFVKQELYPTYQQEYGDSLQSDVLDCQQNGGHKFNQWNLTLSRMKQYLGYKPLLYLARKGVLRSRPVMMPRGQI